MINKQPGGLGGVIPFQNLGITHEVAFGNCNCLLFSMDLTCAKAAPDHKTASSRDPHHRARQGSPHYGATAFQVFIVEIIY